MTRQFTTVYKKRGRWYIGWVEEMPGVNTQGRSLKELRENLKEALEMVIEANRFLATRNLVSVFIVSPWRFLFDEMG